MPLKPARACRVPVCPNTTRHPSGYCDDHAERRKDYDKARGTAADRGYGARWRKIRDAYLRSHPFCETCGEAAQMVDHRKPRRDGGSDRRDNLQSLCLRCHAKKTRRETAARVY